MSKPLDAHVARQVATESFTDPRTVLAVVNGHVARPTTMARLLPVLKRHRIRIAQPEEAEA